MMLHTPTIAPTTATVLPVGYSDVPDGKLAMVVTSLEMLVKPPPRATPAGHIGELNRFVRVEPERYRQLFRCVGAEWLWFARLAMPSEELVAILSDPAVEVYVVSVDGCDEGLLELDFRTSRSCELAYFGLTRKMQGRGAGRWLMNRALDLAWSRPIERFWVHTCTLDHPNALAFYIRSGFRAYARRIEIADDPRRSGVLPRDAAPHVPLIDAACAQPNVAER